MADTQNQICIVFTKVPEGTTYLKNHYSFVAEAKARQYIDEGYGKEFDPKKMKVVEKATEPTEPKPKKTKKKTK